MIRNIFWTYNLKIQLLCEEYWNRHSFYLSLSLAVSKTPCLSLCQSNIPNFKISLSLSLPPPSSLSLCNTIYVALCGVIIIEQLRFNLVPVLTSIDCGISLIYPVCVIGQIVCSCGCSGLVIHSSVPVHWWGHPWYSGSTLDCRSTGRALDPTPVAWFITKFIS